MIGPDLSHNAPATGLFKYWLARAWYGIAGWDVVGELPRHKKFVLIGAHHTSNWDFPYGLLGTYLFRIKTSWMAKHSLFNWPFGWLMRALGGISINRNHAHGVVEQTVDAFKRSEGLIILLSPEGTRSQCDYWKSGFYHIAYRAQVPVVCAYLDYQRKQACIGLSLIPTGHVRQDMDRIRDFYRSVQAKHNGQVSAVRLRNETDIVK